MTIKRTELTAKLVGQETDTLPHYFTEKARKVPLNSVLPYDEWYRNVKTFIESETRFEFIAYDEDDKVVGAMVWARDFEPCVGDILTVRFAYSEDPRALTRGYRLLFHIAKHLRYKHVFYTQLVKGKLYRNEFKEVRLPPEAPVLNEPTAPQKLPKPLSIEPIHSPSSSPISSPEATESVVAPTPKRSRKVDTDEWNLEL